MSQASHTTQPDHHHRGRAARLRAAGLKVTAPRLAILAALERDRRHPTAEMLHASLADSHPSLSLSTVYVTLERFAQHGLIRRVGARNDRQRVDGTIHDHDHAVCRSCGTIFDVDPALLPRPAPPAELPDGLQVTSLHLEYEVVCAACRGAPSRS